MAKQEKDTRDTKIEVPGPTPRVGSPIVSAFLSLRDALKSALADAKAGDHDNTKASGEMLSALLAAGGRLPQIDGHTLRHLLSPRGVSQEAADPDCSRLAGDVATFLGGCMTSGVKAIAEGDVNLPSQQRLAGVLSKSKVWQDAAPVLEAHAQDDEVQRKATEEAAHWARLAAANEAATKAKAGPGVKAPPPLPDLKVGEVIPVS